MSRKHADIYFHEALGPKKIVSYYLSTHALNARDIK